MKCIVVAPSSPLAALILTLFVFWGRGDFWTWFGTIINCEAVTLSACQGLGGVLFVNLVSGRKSLTQIRNCVVASLGICIFCTCGIYRWGFDLPDVSTNLSDRCLTCENSRLL